MRVFAVVMVWFALPFALHRFDRPWLAVGLAVVLTVSSAGLVWWWIRAGAIRPGTIAADLPIGVFALLANGFLVPEHGLTGWTYFAYPATVPAALTLGVAARRLSGALGAGLVLSVAFVMVGVFVRHQPWLATVIVVPAYLVNPAVGWAAARSFRRSSVELARVRQEAVRRVAEVAEERERVRHARALHDHALQTLETLARGDVSDPRLRDVVSRQAAWLRGFVETGRIDASDDLADVARVARERGLRVQVNDALLRAGSVRPDAVVVDAVRAVLVGASVPSVVVRAVPERGGVLVSVLADEGGTLPEVDFGPVRAAGGEVLAESDYVEVWAPCRVNA